MKASLSTLPLVGALVFAGCIPAAQADEATCRTIADALIRMIEQPIVHQVDTRSDFPGPIETIYATDAYYARAGGEWKKIDVTGRLRLAQFRQMLEVSPLRDCAEVGMHKLEDVETRHFKYRQGKPDASSEPIDTQIWIGVTDNLPYRWESKPVVSTMKYKGVTAPR